MNHDTIVILFLLALIVFIELRSYFERRSLMDRIMSKNLTELAGIEEQRRATIPRIIKKEQGVPL